MSTSEEIGRKQYIDKLWLNYKLAVTAEYFAGKSVINGNDCLTWEGPHGIQAAEIHPLITFLAAPHTSTETKATGDN